MKKLIFSLFFLVIVAGCATTPKTYDYEIQNYAKQLASYPLKAGIYYQPDVKGNQLLEMEYNQYGTDKTGYYRVVYGAIVVKKFDSAFARMFTKPERSYVADLPTRFLEAKSKNLDLLCEIKLLKKSFKSEKQEGIVKSLAKAIIIPLPTKTQYSATTELEMRICFHTPDGTVTFEKTYPFTTTESVYISLDDWTKILLDSSNNQFSNGIDEIISRMADDLGNSEKFNELVDSRKKPLS